jgi:hypothetical protein
MAEFDPSKLSNLAADKLQAVLNHGWEGAGSYLPRAYLDACAGWFRSLSTSDMVVAVWAMRAHASGDEDAALRAARRQRRSSRCRDLRRPAAFTCRQPSLLRSLWRTRE